MIILKIPEAAYNAGHDADRRCGTLESIIDAAMSLAFATELRGLRDAIKAKGKQQREDNVASGMFMAVLMIDDEIRRLDPEGLTS